MKKTLIIDSSHLIYRYSGVVEKGLWDIDYALNKLFKSIKKIQDTLKIDETFFAIDSPVPSKKEFFLDLYEKDNTGYKKKRENREKSDVFYELRERFEKTLVDKYKENVFKVPDYEADDIVYALLQKSKKEGNQTFIACNDADLLPLVDNNTVLLYWKQNAYTYPDLEKIDKYLIFDTEYFTDACKTIYSLNKYDVTEDNLLLVKMLRGDPSDDIQGVKGWTPTKVKNILTSNPDLKIKYNMDLKDLENILENKLAFSKEDTKQALKNYQMMDLNSSLNNRRKPLKY